MSENIVTKGAAEVAVGDLLVDFGVVEFVRGSGEYIFIECQIGEDDYGQYEFETTDMLQVIPLG